MRIAIIKAFDVAEVKLYDWKLAVLLCMIVLSASCLHAYWTPTPVREMCHVVLGYLCGVGCLGACTVFAFVPCCCSDLVV